MEDKVRNSQRSIVECIRFYINIMIPKSAFGLNFVKLEYLSQIYKILVLQIFVYIRKVWGRKLFLLKLDGKTKFVWSAMCTYSKILEYKKW